MLGSVAGGGERGDRNLAHADDVAVGQRLVRVGDAGLLRDVDGRTSRLHQPPVAGDVVGMVVRLEHVLDAEAVLFGESEVVVDLPLRVDHRRRLAVGDDVGRAPEIFVQHLPEEHRPGSYVVKYIGNA